MDLEIKECGRGASCHKIPRIGAVKARSCALKDITKECKDGFFTKNYICRESEVLQSLKFKQTIIPI